MDTITVAPPVYEPPSLHWDGADAQAEEGVLWVILVGFSLASATALAAYCIAVGGSPSIEFTWRGFKVTCYR